uniref:Uncharacterized protein n=1 Tax=Romanomermis culicivorax TaxID=13658 RepID=A0A915KXW2_ROMCU
MKEKTKRKKRKNGRKKEKKKQGPKCIQRWINRIMYLVQNYVEQRAKSVNSTTPFDENHPIEITLRDQYNLSVQK